MQRRTEPVPEAPHRGGLASNVEVHRNEEIELRLDFFEHDVSRILGIDVQHIYSIVWYFDQAPEMFRSELALWLESRNVNTMTVMAVTQREVRGHPADTTLPGLSSGFSPGLSSGILSGLSPAEFRPGVHRQCPAAAGKPLKTRVSGCRNPADVVQ